MNAVALATIGLLVAGFAGCTDAPVVQQEEESFEEFELEATAETGVIRGVVVDDTITPVVGATIRLENTDITAVSNANGAFGIDDLEPGTYFLMVDAVGYAATQASTVVEAGIENPPVLRVTMLKDASELPYTIPLQFNGYIACSISTIAYRVAACGASEIVTNILGQPPITDDDFLRTFSVDAGSQFLQAEMLWQSTQPVGDYLSLGIEHDASYEGRMNGSQGPSPLVAKTYQADIDRSGFGADGSLQERVFNMEYPGTAPPVPVCGIPNYIHGGTMCAKGWGATIEQAFEIFTHVFYKWQPEDSWQFSVDGPPYPPE